MNPAEELKKIANALEKKADDAPIEYVKLVRIDNENELLKEAQAFGVDTVEQFANEIGYPLSDLLGCYYVQGDDGGYLFFKWEDLPSGLTPGLVKPIWVYAGQRLFHEKAKRLSDMSLVLAWGSKVILSIHWNEHMKTSSLRQADP